MNIRSRLGLAWPALPPPPTQCMQLHATHTALGVWPAKTLQSPSAQHSLPPNKCMHSRAHSSAPEPLHSSPSRCSSTQPGSHTHFGRFDLARQCLCGRDTCTRGCQPIPTLLSFPRHMRCRQHQPSLEPLHPLHARPRDQTHSRGAVTASSTQPPPSGAVRRGWHASLCGGAAAAAQAALGAAKRTPGHHGVDTAIGPVHHTHCGSVWIRAGGRGVATHCPPSTGSGDRRSSCRPPGVCGCAAIGPVYTNCSTAQPPSASDPPPPSPSP